MADSGNRRKIRLAQPVGPLVPWSIVAAYIGTFVVFAGLTVFFVLTAISDNNHNLCPLLDTLHSTSAASSSSQPQSAYGKHLENGINTAWRRYGCM